MNQVMWTFTTCNFRVEWRVSPCLDLDLSWDDTGETRDMLERGLWEAFDSEIRVTYRGAIVGQDFLGQSIYEDVDDFRTDGYFRDMVREAIADARRNLRDMPRLRAA